MFKVWQNSPMRKIVVLNLSVAVFLLTLAGGVATFARAPKALVCLLFTPNGDSQVLDINSGVFIRDRRWDTALDEAPNRNASPNGQYAVASRNVQDAASGFAMTSLSLQRPNQPELSLGTFYTVQDNAWSQDGRYLSFITGDINNNQKQVHIVDLESGKINQVNLPNNSNYAFLTGWSADGRYMTLVRGYDFFGVTMVSTMIYDQDGQLVAEVPTSQNASLVWLTPTRIALTRMGTGSLEVVMYDLTDASNGLAKPISHKIPVSIASLQPLIFASDNYLALTTTDGRFDTYFSVLKIEENRITPVGNILYSVGSLGGGAVLWDGDALLFWRSVGYGNYELIRYDAANQRETVLVQNGFVFGNATDPLSTPLLNPKTQTKLAVVTYATPDQSYAADILALDGSIRRTVLTGATNIIGVDVADDSSSAIIAWRKGPAQNLTWVSADGQTSQTVEGVGQRLTQIGWLGESRIALAYRNAENSALTVEMIDFVSGERRALLKDLVNVRSIVVSGENGATESLDVFQQRRQSVLQNFVRLHLGDKQGFFLWWQRQNDLGEISDGISAFDLFGTSIYTFIAPNINARQGESLNFYPSPDFKMAAMVRYEAERAANVRMSNARLYLATNDGETRTIWESGQLDTVVWAADNSKLYARANNQPLVAISPPSRGSSSFGPGIAPPAAVPPPLQFSALVFSADGHLLRMHTFTEGIVPNIPEWTTCFAPPA
jgi:hypothetical protein